MPRRQRRGGPPKTETLQLKPKDYVKGKHVLGLGSGDSELFLDFLPDAVAETAFEAVRDEVKWQKMLLMGRPVPRLVSMQAVHDGSSVPLYRHPTDTQPEVAAFTPFVEAIARRASELVKSQSNPVAFNHALVQLYRSGDDHISDHADKTLDIERGTPIVSVSLGASRLFTLKSKTKLASGKGPKCQQKLALPHNSLFVLGLDTNRHFTHAVGPDKRATGQRRPDENAFDGQRISITLRRVSTFVRDADSQIYGQGAKHKTEAELDAAIALGEGDLYAEVNSDIDDDSSKMLAAFRKENKHSVEFDWSEAYGTGFNALDLGMHFKPNLSTRKRTKDVAVTENEAVLNGLEARAA